MKETSAHFVGKKISAWLLLRNGRIVGRLAVCGDRKNTTKVNLFRN